MFFLLIYCYIQLFAFCSHFIKQEYVSETMDPCVFDVHNMEMKSLGDCALHCGMNLLCNDFDVCFFDGFTTSRFRAMDTQTF